LKTISKEEAWGIFEEALSGDRRAIGRLLSLVESPSADSLDIIREMIKRSGKSHIVGVTGVAGAGKSTLISRLITELRKKGYRVAVIAIDPSSPFSTGAFLGDRVRMQKHATDQGVFIRSLASRGLKGGLSLATLLTIEAFDSLGFDKIIVETVGAGQVDIDIFYAAMSILVVTLPAAGDEIQALKAGLMEIGDIYAVNKADKLDADEAVEHIKFALESGELKEKGGWVPKIIKTSAITGQGIADIAEALDEHLDFLVKTSKFNELILARREHLMRVLLSWLAEVEINRRLDKISDLLEAVKNGEIDPISGALEAFRKIFEK